MAPRPRPRLLIGTAFAVACIALLGTMVVGCGHPATREECVTILNKSAELKLREQNVTNPELIEQRTNQLKEAKGERLIEQCIGRRITDSALKCVERADSAAAVDRCLY